MRPVEPQLKREMQACSHATRFDSKQTRAAGHLARNESEIAALRLKTSGIAFACPPNSKHPIAASSNPPWPYGPAMFKHVCATGLEGVVSKLRNGRYPSGRSNDWVKVTCAQRETLPIAGYALDGQKWDGIYLARRKGNDLVYAGKVDHGFSPQN